eukprot:TRINITY_DN2787_c2_g3_i1.p1 TRINITY_DN2787_c2_g3~~TRINITY_DN2787_c2_g3_i1.p1  ORF type:complete len:294 (+),score=34.23 TRINITY_DN2787_c2_g3_i1:28-909(+)
MTGGGWLNLRREEEPPTDPENGNCDGGIATLEFNAQRVASQEFKRSFTIWFIGGSIIGPPILIYPLYLKRKRELQLVSPWQVGMWLGVIAGMFSWSIFFPFLTRFFSLPKILNMILPGLGLVCAYGIYTFFKSTRRKYYHLIAPSPVNQIFGMRDGEETMVDFLMISETPPQTVPLNGADTSPPSVHEVCKHVMDKINQPLRVAVLLCAVDVVVMICPIFLWSMLYVIPVALIFVIIIVFDAIGCYNGRRYLKEVNQHPLMVRRNIKWVLRIQLPVQNILTLVGQGKPKQHSD